MRSSIYFFLLLSFWACNKGESLLPEVSEVPEETGIPEETRPPVSSLIPFSLPEPQNPSNQVLVLKRLNSVVNYGTKMVDTTVYHYNANGEVIAEFFTSFMTGRHDGGFKKYRAYPENLNVPGKAYAYIHSGYEVADLYCDDQKRVIKAVRGNTITHYQYDDDGRLSRSVDSLFNTAKVTTYRYFNRSETGLDYDYYTVQSPSEAVTYILSNTVKAGEPLKYLFNYGKVPEYAVERKITGGQGYSHSFSYSYKFTDNNRILEQNFKSGQYDLWVKYIY